MTIYEILTVVAYVLGAIVSFVLKEKASELQRQGILLNKTREEMARDYITKVEVRSDMEKIINRFDRIEAKLDRFIEGHK
jgi:archaellum component FlaC